MHVFLAKYGVPIGLQAKSNSSVYSNTVPEQGRSQQTPLSQMLRQVQQLGRTLWLHFHAVYCSTEFQDNGSRAIFNGFPLWRATAITEDAASLLKVSPQQQQYTGS